MYRKGFTLVEILIVVIILGILAAIVIPQFTEASQDARESALRSDLQTLRSQLELYKVQHLDHYPNEVYAEGAWGADTDNFIARLEGTTDLYGDTTGSDYGPYLQQFPTNPFAAANADVVEFGAAAAPPSADGDPGWYFSTDTGQVFANTADHSSF